VRKYWELKANEPDSSLGCKELEEKIRQILSKSVLMETISDVPLGLFLSGGVDSSLIAHCLKDHDQIEAYTVGTNSALDESKIALAVCEHLGVKNRTLFVKGDNFFDKFDDWMFYNDDPVANPSALALMLVAEFARSDGKKVMLSGDGADELFGGYESYLKYKWISKIWWMTRILLPKGLIRKLPLPGGLQAIDYLSHKEIKTFLGTAHITDKALRGSLLNKVNDNASNIFEDLDGQLAGGRLIRTALLIDQATRLPCDLLMTTDRATMAVSLETRVPYLNQIMVDAANRLPDAACVSNFKTKVLLKRVASTVLPHDSVYRPKMGFDLPVEIWLKNEFRDQLYSFAGEKKIDFINYDGFMILIDNFMKDEKKTGWHSPIVWALLVLETWYRNWSRPTFERPLNDYVRNGLALQKINSLMELN
jgi:asparagine synthase (glutamine-hydrolysing)